MIQRGSIRDRKENRHVAKLATAHQIGIFGRVRHQKGIDVLIDAAIPILLERPDWGMLVVGEIKPEDASYVDELKRRINEAGLNERIKFAGLQPFSTLPGFFRHSDVVAALSRNEGYGLTVLEAMSSGCAVIASTAGAWPDIITHGENGLLVPIADVEATRASLIHLVDREEARIAMGSEARSQVLAQYRVEDEARSVMSVVPGAYSGSEIVVSRRHHRLLLDSARRFNNFL